MTKTNKVNFRTTEKQNCIINAGEELYGSKQRFFDILLEHGEIIIRTEIDKNKNPQVFTMADFKKAMFEGR